MRVVSFTGNRLELNFMWLPTFISQNMYVMRELEQEWKQRFFGTHATEEALEGINAWTIDWLAKRFGIPGLATYLSAIKEVKEGDDGVHESSSQRVLLDAQKCIDRTAG